MLNEHNNKRNRIDKEDIKKERRKKKTTSSMKYLLNIPLQDIQKIYSVYNLSVQQIKEKAEALYYYCQAKGKRYDNYKAFLLNIIRKDYGKRNKPIPIRQKLKVSLDEIYDRH